VSETIKTEYTGVEREVQRDRGLASPGGVRTKSGAQSVFDGLTANRRSCVYCGYTEAVMHFSFDSWQLSFGRMAASYHLDELLDEYTRLETLHDCICRKCSMNATYKRLKHEAATLTATLEAPNAKPSSSKKRRLKEVKKMETRVREALLEGRIEEDLKDVRMDKAFGMSTKQSMVARASLSCALF
jgi:ubiquitin carboxyl-terminal hydrolase 1